MPGCSVWSGRLHASCSRSPRPLPTQTYRLRFRLRLSLRTGQRSRLRHCAAAPGHRARALNGVTPAHRRSHRPGPDRPSHRPGSDRPSHQSEVADTHVPRLTQLSRLTAATGTVRQRRPVPVADAKKHDGSLYSKCVLPTTKIVLYLKHCVIWDCRPMRSVFRTRSS